MSDDDVARREAATDWISKLSCTRVSNEDRRAFFAWRRDPANNRVWEALEAGRKRVSRFVVRPQTERFRVVDIWTGETAITALTPQDDMSEEDAIHTARMMNRRAAGGDRSVPQ